MKGFKRTALIGVAIISLSVTESALAKPKEGSGKQERNDTPVPLPETGSTLLLLGIALAGVEGCRRWIARKSTC